jgi:hypothetical protein
MRNTPSGASRTRNSMRRDIKALRTKRRSVLLTAIACCLAQAVLTAQPTDVPLNREALDVNEIVRETVALLRDKAMRDYISVRTELGTDLLPIVGDRVPLRSNPGAGSNRVDAIRPDTASVSA